MGSRGAGANIATDGYYHAKKDTKKIMSQNTEVE